MSVPVQVLLAVTNHKEVMSTKFARRPCNNVPLIHCISILAADDSWAENYFFRFFFFASLVLVRWYIRRRHIALVSRTVTKQSNTHSLDGNTGLNQTRKGGFTIKIGLENFGLQQWSFFHANKVFAHIHSKQECNGHEYVGLTHVKIYQNVKTQTNEIKQVFGIHILLCFYLMKGGCLQWEDMNIIHH